MFKEQKHHTFENKLNRQFKPTAPNQVWADDVTYIRTEQGFCYLAVVIDLYARHIVGFAVSDHPDSTLTSDALKMAYTVRLQPKNVLFHSDHTHYTSQQFAQSIAQCTGMQHSMSRKGNCWDNAPTERFFRSFKSEWMPKKGYTNRIQAQQDIADYILGYYSSIRPHQFNEYLSPLQKERLFFSHGS